MLAITRKGERQCSINFGQIHFYEKFRQLNAEYVVIKTK